MNNKTIKLIYMNLTLAPCHISRTFFQMRKIHGVSLVLGLFLSCTRTDAVVWEAEMPNLLGECYKQLTADLTPSDIPSHAVMSHCLGSYIWENPDTRYQLNLTQYQVNYVRSIYREYQQRLHNGRRNKRQAQRAIRRELRVLSDEQRQRFFDALDVLKAEGVNECKRLLIKYY
jgi:uncharacterized membrane protein